VHPACDVGPRSARWKRAIDYYQPLRVPHEDGHSARGESDHLSNQEAAKQIQHYYMPESHEVATPGMPRRGATCNVTAPRADSRAPLIAPHSDSRFRTVRCAVYDQRWRGTVHWRPPVGRGRSHRPDSKSPRVTAHATRTRVSSVRLRLIKTLTLRCGWRMAHAPQRAGSTLRLRSHGTQIKRSEPNATRFSASPADCINQERWPPSAGAWLSSSARAR
jgi:hypothetical protein